MGNWIFGNNEQSELDKKLDAIEEKMDQKIAELEAKKDELIKDNKSKMQEIKDLSDKLDRRAKR